MSRARPLWCATALLVNPYDTEAVGNAIEQALSMPLEERKGRHGQIIKALAENDIRMWGERFIEVLVQPDKRAEAAA